MNNALHCLAVQQPWASQIAFGDKTVEYRSWKPYKGIDRFILTISGRPMRLEKEEGDAPEVVEILPVGWAIATAQITDVLPDEEYGWAWHLANVQEIMPVRVKNWLKFFRPDPPIIPVPLEGYEDHRDAIAAVAPEEVYKKAGRTWAEK